MICHHCAARIALSEVTFCPRCGTRITDQPVANATVSPHPFPWDEVLSNEQPFKLLVTTITEALFHPSRFYRQAVNHSERLLPALLYALITGGIGLTASWVWSLWLPPGVATSSVNHLFSNTSTSSASTLTAAPILLLLQLFLSSFYIFIVLRLGRFKQYGYQRLLRLLCFVETPMLLQVIPFVGGFLATLFWIYALLTMLRLLYEGSRIKILFFLLLPLLVLSLLAMLILFAGLIGGIIAGMGLLPDWTSLLDFL